MAPLEPEAPPAEAVVVEGPGGEVGEDLAQQVQESVVVRAKRGPLQPTRAEIEDHESAHEPYRSWCWACVSGRGKQDGHTARDHEQDGVAVLGVDYGYLNSKAKNLPGDDEEVGVDGQRASPLLCGRNSQTMWLVGHVLRSKGAEDVHSVKTMLNEFVLHGAPKLIVRSDQEPAIRRLCTTSGARARVEAGMTIIPEEAPRGDSQANGLAEGAVRDLKAKVRTLKAALERFLGITVDHTHRCLPWLVMYAAATINRCRRGADGRTPYERAFGRRWTQPMVKFGEFVLWLAPGKRASRLASGMKQGVYLGIRDISGEHYVGTPEGVFVARTIRRVLPELQANKDEFEKFRGAPWAKTAEEVADPAAATGISLHVAAGPLVEPDVPPPPEPAGAPRDVKIRRAVELVKFGFTQGCPGCVAAATGGAPVHHTEACRRRIKAEMEKDPELRQRVARAREARSEHQARSMEVEIAPGPEGAGQSRGAGASGAARGPCRAPGSGRSARRARRPSAR